MNTVCDGTRTSAEFPTVASRIRADEGVQLINVNRFGFAFADCVGGVGHSSFSMVFLTVRPEGLMATLRVAITHVLRHRTLGGARKRVSA